MPVAELDRITGLEIPRGVTLRHYSKTIGTEVIGLDLREELPAETVAFLRALWLERKAVFFHDQDITPEQHIRFGRYFGRLDTFPTNELTELKGYPEMLVFRRGLTADEKEAFFHVDAAFSNPPIAGTIARLAECPSIGGDTIFVDMAAAYDGLSPWLKSAIADLEAEQRFDVAIKFYNPIIKQELIDRMMSKWPPVNFPVVTTHPVTARKILFVNIGYTAGIVGLPRDESFALVKLLSDKALVPEYQCRFIWRKNSIGMWDNRAVQHYACFDYEGEYRELQRVVILGEERWPGT